MSACDSFRSSSVPTGRVRFTHLSPWEAPGGLCGLCGLWIDVRDCNQETLERISPTPDLVRGTQRNAGAAEAHISRRRGGP